MIPRFKYYFYPCLSALSDGDERVFSDIKNYSAECLNLSEYDLKEQLSSGTYRHNDRCSWALSYLKKLKLVTYINRKYQITELGKITLERYGKDFDLSVVRDLEGFGDFQKKKDRKGYWIPSHYTASEIQIQKK